jgi:hypothetical protein
VKMPQPGYPIPNAASTPKNAAFLVLYLVVS